MIGCLCIHGYTGGPYEVQPLVDYLEQRTNWMFEVPTLPGHGRKLDLKGRYYQEWIATAELAFLKLAKTCDVVYVIGFSMGGMIAAYLAGKYKVDRLVLLSAAGKYISVPQMYKDITDFVAEALKGTLADNDLFLHYQDKLKQTPFPSSIEFVKLIRFTRPFLKEVQVPVLIIQGQQDEMVPDKAAIYLEQEIPSTDKQLVFMKESKHLICYGKDKEELFETVMSFLTR
ncbi:carboxylesterase [Thalassobacillus devorans]|uniref:Carboxylesterase n=1 Tax=Thalassobacillus devorans TaxID=279813 RepID=A0ABQ1PVZ5_9BACI|nr:alpha/beta fold hydrolase [Thalassobacillus devorans]NIK30891.1 esterase/lipase [Thalassobacillus devorans]GGD05073.1 carboxylesterase [Thalassobacillus devorans]